MGSEIKCRRVHQCMCRQTCSPAADKTAAAASADNCRYRYQPLSLFLWSWQFSKKGQLERQKKTG